MATNLGTAYVDVQGNFDGLTGALDGILAGGKWKKIAVGVAGIGAAGIAAGKALYDIGGQFDDAYDKIRVSTGKTGSGLKGLERDFKSVVKNVPTDFGSAADAISLVNQRLGLTGKPLQGLSEQFLELSRITGTDLSTNIESVTRAFGDWGVTTKDQPKKLDELFRAFQKTGVPVDKLGQLITKYGAPLRQLGFNFEQSAAMIGKFEKEGVNTQLVMGSMRLALGKMAKAGEDPIDTFKRVSGEIKNAGSTAEANKLAMELFGAKAGPDMAAAIREGRFDLGELTKQISGSGDTIKKAGKDTQDFAEKWQMFKNKVLVGLEPIATKVFGAIGTAMDNIGPAVDKLKDMFSRVGGGEGAGKLSKALVSVKDAFQGIWDIAQAFWDKFGGIITDGLKDTADAFLGFVEAGARILQGIVDLVAGVFTGDWGRAWDGIKEIFGGVWDAIKTLLRRVWENIKTIISLGLIVIGAILSEGWDIIKDAVRDAWNWIKDKISSAFSSARDKVVEIASSILDKTKAAWEDVKTAVRNAWDWVKDKILGALRGARDTIAEIGAGITNRLGDAWTAVKNGVRDAWDWVKEKVLGTLRDARDAVPDILTGLWNRVESGFKRIVNGAGDFAGDVKDKVGDAFKGAANLAIGFVNAIIRAINLIPGIPNIPQIPKLAEGGTTKSLDIPGFARGGVMHHNEFARGGEITRPLVIVGEEAPRHNEFVIPTNPAYRGRALGLYQQLGQQLGVPGMFMGGILGKAFDIARNGASSILGKLPGIGSLPDWLSGTGKYVLGQAKDFIVEKVKGLLGGGGDGSPASRIASMVKFMDTVDKWKFPYVYGGGHGSFAGPYDCSGLVSAVLHAGGFLGSPMTTDGLKVYGEGGDGKYITIGVRGSTGRNAHTMMKIGDQYLESGSGHGAKWVSGWAGNFPIHRHPPGFAEGGIFGEQVARLVGEKALGWGLKKGGTTLPFVGSYADGGIVPADGIARVHQGEAILPNGFQPEVRVYIGDTELRDIVRVEVDDRDRSATSAYMAGSLR